MRKKEGENLSEYKIFETDEFRKQLEKFNTTPRRFIQNKLSKFAYKQLRTNPLNGNNIRILKGYKPKIWRYRISKYRIFYSIDFDNKIVHLLTIDHRKNVYR